MPPVSVTAAMLRSPCEKSTFTDDPVIQGPTTDNNKKKIYHVKQVEKFKYLGSTITSDGRNDAEIKIRIGMAKDAFQKMEKVIKNKNITT